MMTHGCVCHFNKVRKKMLTPEVQTTKRKRTCKGIGSLTESQITCEGTNHSSVSSEAGFGTLSKFDDSSFDGLRQRVASAFSEYVVSVASFHGDTMLFGCTGLFIATTCYDATSILTSASLVRSDSDESKSVYDMTIKVRLPNGPIVTGWLHYYDLNHDFAIVNIEYLHGFPAPIICSRFQSRGEVAALERCFNSGELTTTFGLEIGKLSDGLCGLMHSTSKLNKACIGSLLVDFDARFVGINCHGGEMAFLPRDRIIECLENSGIIRNDDLNQGVDGTMKTFKTAFLYFCDVARRDGYPFPDMIQCENFSAMHVFNSFEEEFTGDIWSNLSKETGLTLSEYVVALSSFNEDARHFACTGVFINCYPARILTSASLIRNAGDKSTIHDNLRIEVCFRDKTRVVATLKHYDLHCNVAIVEILGFRSPRAVELKKDIPFTPNSDVLAVGCCFKSCKFMATKGVLVDKPCKLDGGLGSSTCNITKAGIGGPLVDMSGNFVGLNFYHEKETPYIPRKIIQELLKEFDAERHEAAVTSNKGDPYRWVVPEPYWSYPPFPMREEVTEQPYYPLFVTEEMC